MCGITGFFASRPLNARDYLAGHRLLAHRGPDDEGFVALVGGTVTPMRGTRTIAQFQHLPALTQDMHVPWVLGHHRLSIVDLTAAGHQPMVDTHERYWVVFNGEIYNHIELREQLAAMGRSFRSHSDTEVILQAFDQWGPACFNRFNGMWAIALLDLQQQKLWLCRDRAGVKPLYWSLNNQTLYFASELKFMRQVLGTAAVNQTLAADFLATARTDHHEQTLIEHVNALQPGHYLTFDLQSQATQLRSYWNMPDLTATTELSFDQAVHSLRELLNSAIDLRMRSDVPVGSLLSGGIDSTAIATNLASRGRIGPSGFHSYSAVYDDDPHSERVYIEQTQQRYPDIRAHFVIPDPAKIPGDIADLLDSQDGPVRSLAVYAQYCLYRAIAQDGLVKVLLNGQGADELFAGYGNYRYSWAAQALPNLPRAVGRLPSTSRSSPAQMLHALRWIVSLRYGRQTSRHDCPIDIPVPLEEPARSGGAFILRRELRQSLRISALPEYLRYEDRNSMRFSLESRLPFLDYRILEFAARLPGEWLLNNRHTKVILRQAIKPYATDVVLARRDKTGFVTPQEKWQRNELREFMLDNLQAAQFSFLPQAQWRAWREQYVRDCNSPFFAWRAVSLHLWMRQWNP